MDSSFGLSKAISILVAAIVFLGLPWAALGQAWTQDKGSAYLKVAHGRTSVSDQFDLDGNSVPFLPSVDGDAFFDRSVYLYGEFGVLNGFTLVGMVPIKNLAILDSDGEELKTVGLADIEIRGRVDLRPILGSDESSTAASISVGARLPTGYTRNLSPSVGSGQADIQISMSLGRGFSPLPVYAQATAGFVNRLSAFGLSRVIECTGSGDLACVEPSSPDFDNEWIYSAETGISIGSRLLVQLLMSGVRSVNAPEEQLDTNNPIPTRPRFTKLGGGITVEVSKGVGTSIQLFRTVAGKNTIIATELFFGIEYKISRLD